MKKQKTNSLAMITFCSLLIFALLIVTTSMTPLSQIGKATNQFGSIGMYSAIGMATACYLIPFIIYLVGIRQMKYVMALFCGIGILSAISTFITFIMIAFYSLHQYTHFIIPIIASVLLVITNVVWFFVAFSKNKTNNYNYLSP